MAEEILNVETTYKNIVVILNEDWWVSTTKCELPVGAISYEISDVSLYGNDAMEYYIENDEVKWKEKTGIALQKVEKYKGKAYNGFLIPFTSEDAIGMLQVNQAFQLGIASTIIKFSNGTNMPINVDDFEAFAIWFATERNKLFTKEL